MYVHLTKLINLLQKNSHRAHGKGESVQLLQLEKRPKPLPVRASPHQPQGAQNTQATEKALGENYFFLNYFAHSSTNVFWINSGSIYCYLLPSYRYHRGQEAKAAGQAQGCDRNPATLQLPYGIFRRQPQWKCCNKLTSITEEDFTAESDYSENTESIFHSRLCRAAGWMVTMWTNSSLFTINTENDDFAERV